jgi:hypothetical protein
MVSKTKIALIAAIAAFGIATPALAEGFLVIPQYSLPSEAANYGVAPIANGRQAVVHGRTLYNSAASPAYNVNGNWANDAQGSATNQVAH